MANKTNKPARIAKASPAVQAKTLEAIGKVAYDSASQGATIDRSIDATIKAALTNCDDSEGKRRKAIGEAFKLHFAAALLITCSNNLPMASRVAHAEKLKAMAPGPVMVNGKIVAPTGKLTKGQKRRTLEQQADWALAYQVNAAKKLSRALDRLGLKATNATGSKSAASRKAKADKAKADAAKLDKGAVIQLSKVAKFMPPARKDMTPMALAAYITNQAATVQTVLQDAVQTFSHKKQTVDGLMALGTIIGDYRAAVTKAAAALA